MDSKHMKVSIITPSYNQGQFIERTILSVLNQSYKNIQYILVDGGSTDNTMEVVNRYKDKIDIIIHESDKGQSDAINKGFKLAEGELVGWINSDDVLYQRAVEKVVKIYSNLNPIKPAVLMPNSVNWIDESDLVIKLRSIKAHKRDDLINNDYNVVQQGSFYRNSLVRKVGFCNEDIHYCMDLDLILRLTLHGDLYMINGPIAGFRMSDFTKTSTGFEKFLKDIELCLERNGLKRFSKNWFKLKKELFKGTIKNAIGFR
ncbi:Glycosyltransferase involved in cell wall bisynthesis [bacterium A37T11]|nr:Glycosyltransferase involved in cell wall bisynthesis [bacterium A37T11]